MRTERLESRRCLCRGKDANHRAHRMADENDIFEPQLFTNIEHVRGVSVERAVLRSIVRRQIRPTRSHVIEQDDAIRVLEGRSHVAPHVLVAAKTVREHHRLVAMAGDADVVANNSGHGGSGEISACEAGSVDSIR